MKKFISILTICIMALLTALPADAADGKVTYDGTAQHFIFEPGGDASPSNLFPDFTDVMPGDILTQKITVKNDADRKVKVKIYLRSLGANPDSEAFLSQLGLKVKKSEDNETAYMFDAASDETAQLTDWVLLGTLYSGGEVNLNVTLQVPIALGNEFQSQIGYLDWEFKVEELPVEPDDPQVPPTGDHSRIGQYLALLLGSLFALIVLLIWHKKRKENEVNTINH